MTQNDETLSIGILSMILWVPRGVIAVRRLSCRSGQHRQPFATGELAHIRYLDPSTATLVGNLISTGPSPEYSLSILEDYAATLA